MPPRLAGVVAVVLLLVACALLLLRLGPSGTNDKELASVSPGAAPGVPAAADAPARYRATGGTLPANFDAAALRNVEVGSEFMFHLPHIGRSLPALVSTRSEHANGDISLVASWLDQPGSLVVTLGALQSFATASVAGEVFNLTAGSTGAWAVEAPALGGAVAADALPAPAAVAPARPPLQVNTP